MLAELRQHMAHIGLNPPNSGGARLAEQLPDNVRTPSELPGFAGAAFG